MNATERSIFGQFEYWRALPSVPEMAQPGQIYAVVGCGSSFYLATTIAAALNVNGYLATPVPGHEWTVRPGTYLASPDVTVIAISRSGESTGTVAAAWASRERGQRVIAISCEPQSTLVREAETALVASTHPDEGIVMTSSASLMLLLGLRFARHQLDTDDLATRAESLLRDLSQAPTDWMRGRRHLVFLGGGALYGIASEAALKAMEMRCSVTQAFHPLEYRHGPISLADESMAAVVLYGNDAAAEARLASELQRLGATVAGFGGPGDISLPLDGHETIRAVITLPALQWLGEILARHKGLDTATPRHLSKVVQFG
jgi:glucosamine--fructose-6-phosphate aminotransferase (isomerizing)